MLAPRHYDPPMNAAIVTGAIGVASRSLRDAATEISRIAGERREAQPRPPVEGLVIEVGGGHSPHPRTDVHVEKYVDDDFERGFAVSYVKPLIVGDGHAIPFTDGCASYIIASHVLEHATDPERFAAELSRVAEAGFAQMPTRLAELTFGWRFHPWLVDLDDDGTLVFHARQGQAAPCGSYFHEQFEQSQLFRLWWTANRSRWHHTVHWRGRLQARQAGDTSRAERSAAFDLERTAALLEEAGGRAAIPAVPAAIRAVLRCPADHGALADRPGALECTTCGRAYPVAAGVPILLAEVSSPPVEREAGQPGVPLTHEPG
jgi:uncharacterized protein YbaR (Trm112 family)